MMKKSANKPAECLMKYHTILTEITGQFGERNKNVWNL